MAYIYKDGKVSNISVSDIKLPKDVIKKVDSNKESRKVVLAAVNTVKASKVIHAF